MLRGDVIGRTREKVYRENMVDEVRFVHGVHRVDDVSRADRVDEVHLVDPDYQVPAVNPWTHPQRPQGVPGVPCVRFGRVIPQVGEGERWAQATASVGGTASSWGRGAGTAAAGTWAADSSLMNAKGAR